MTRTKCTASGEVRSWSQDAWINNDAECPDCGARIEVVVRGTDLFPWAKARAHRAPEGVEPAPYKLTNPTGGRSWREAHAE